MMSDKSQVPQGGSRLSSQSQQSIDWKQCILCQSDDAKKGILVQNPRIISYEHVLEIVQERANLSDGDFVNVQRRLQNSTPQMETGTSNSPSRKIVLVDGMVLVQRLTKKPATIVTVKDLSVCFNDRLMSLTQDYDEIVLVFDTYKADSLKSATREKRRDGKAPVQYQVRDDTNIKHILRSRFLSHDNTKADLTGYLASKTLKYNMESPKLIITSASGHTRSNKDLYFEDNNHEEADTLLIHQAVLASQRNPSHSQLVFFSPDTDVLVLVTANYDMLLKNTSVSMTSGVVHIGAVWKALGPARAKALPAFRAFTGADNTGRFSRVGKANWLQAYLRTDEDVINALQMLEEAEVTDGLLSTLAGFYVQPTHPRASPSRRSQNCVGTCLPNIWRRVTSYPQQSGL